MKGKVIFSPKRPRGLLCLILTILCFVRAAKTEITCRSCRPGNKWHPKELLLKFETRKYATRVRGEVSGYGEGAGKAAIRESRCTDESADCVSEGVHPEKRLKRISDDVHEKRKNGSKFSKTKFSTVKLSAGFTFATKYETRVRRNSNDEVQYHRLSQSRKQAAGMRHTARGVTRSELRWSGDEPRDATSRQEEPKLNSSTFALTGDSSHNQAMVHWSGQNSSVILMLTKLYDYNLNSVTESSLWRSTDYGATYQKLNNKVGAKTILSYLYVSPNNKRKIMLLTDTEVENSLLISSDEGATYQKYRLDFYILSLLFHPEQEDWILAYSHDQKVLL